MVTKKIIGERNGNDVAVEEKKRETDMVGEMQCGFEARTWFRLYF